MAPATSASAVGRSTPAMVIARAAERTKAPATWRLSACLRIGDVRDDLDVTVRRPVAVVTGKLFWFPNLDLIFHVRTPCCAHAR